MHDTATATNVFHFSVPLLALVSMWERPLERLSWCHLGHAESPYCGGGGGGGGSVKTMVMTTVALPAAPASILRFAVRVPEKAELATLTETTCPAPPASAPDFAAKPTAASS